MYNKVWITAHPLDITLITLALDKYNTTSLNSLTRRTAPVGHQKATFTLTFPNSIFNCKTTFIRQSFLFSLNWTTFANFRQRILGISEWYLLVCRSRWRKLRGHEIRYILVNAGRQSLRSGFIEESGKFQHGTVVEVRFSCGCQFCIAGKWEYVGTLPLMF